jgi:hypothetical protein
MAIASAIADDDALASLTGGPNAPLRFEERPPGRRSGLLSWGGDLHRTNGDNRHGVDCAAHVRLQLRQRLAPGDDPRRTTMDRTIDWTRRRPVSGRTPPRRAICLASQSESNRPRAGKSTPLYFPARRTPKRPTVNVENSPAAMTRVTAVNSTSADAGDAIVRTVATTSASAVAARMSLMPPPTAG